MLEDNSCESILGFLEAADDQIAIENLLHQIQWPVIIVVGGFVADRGVLPGNPIKTLGEFDFIAGNLLHPGPK